MARFAQYYLKYDLTDMFARERMAERQKIFGSYFENNDSIEFSHGEGEEKKVFKHQVYHLALNRNIIVMRIANDKKKTVEQDFKEVDVKHEPSCFVVIDNRDKCRRIAIQKKKGLRQHKGFGRDIDLSNQRQDEMRLQHQHRTSSPVLPQGLLRGVAPATASYIEIALQCL